MWSPTVLNFGSLVVIVVSNDTQWYPQCIHWHPHRNRCKSFGPKRNYSALAICLIQTMAQPQQEWRALSSGGGNMYRELPTKEMIEDQSFGDSWFHVIPEMLLASVVSMEPFRGHTTTLGTAAGDLWSFHHEHLGCVTGGGARYVHVAQRWQREKRGSSGEDITWNASKCYYYIMVGLLQSLCFHDVEYEYCWILRGIPRNSVMAKVVVGCCGALEDGHTVGQWFQPCTGPRSWLDF